MPTPASEQQIRDALRDILAWEEMARSPQLIDFLTYIVEKSLAGEEDSIKAYAIAVDVFNRPPDFDPQSDPIVRVQGGRLRRLLARYYAEGRNKVPVTITIPTGRYVPKYILIEDPVVDSYPVNRESTTLDDHSAPLKNQSAPIEMLLMWFQRRPGLFLTFLIALPVVIPIILFALTQALQTNRSAIMPDVASNELEWVLPKPPVIHMGEVKNITGNPSLDKPVADLPLQLEADFARFDDLIVRRRNNIPVTGTVGDQPLENEYTVTGVVRQSNIGIEFNFFLSADASDEVLWSGTYREPATFSDIELLFAQIARRVTSTLGSIRGPLHASAMAVLPDLPEDAASNYVCLLLKYNAEDNYDFDQLARAHTCFGHLIAENPQSAIGLAGWAGLETLRLWRGVLPGEDMTEKMFDVTQAAIRARDLMPQSSFVRSQLAQVYLIQNDMMRAREEFVAALTRNPSDLTVRASYAVFLGFGGKWDEGEAQMEMAIKDDPSPPKWFYMLRAINNMRRNDYPAALSAALVVSESNQRLGKVLALSAAPLAARADVVERMYSIVADDPEFQRIGVLPSLSRRIVDEDVLDLIGYGLTLAGLPHELIHGPFAGPVTPDANQSDNDREGLGSE